MAPPQNLSVLSRSIPPPDITIGNCNFNTEMKWLKSPRPPPDHPITIGNCNVKKEMRWPKSPRPPPDHPITIAIHCLSAASLEVQSAKCGIPEVLARGAAREVQSAKCGIPEVLARGAAREVQSAKCGIPVVLVRAGAGRLLVGHCGKVEEDNPTCETLKKLHFARCTFFCAT